MKKRSSSILIFLLLLPAVCFSQEEKNSYTSRKLTETEIQAAFSFYTQDNDHSAITGGKGTEDLQVYSSKFLIEVVKDSVKRFQLDGGVDVISSASTDNIDYAVSSASKVDARTHLQGGYERRLTNGLTVGSKAGLSIESDYTSFGFEAHVHHLEQETGNEWNLSMQTFLDDLRWGRLESGRPQMLIYPAELRGTDWFDRYRRNSFNLAGEWLHPVNRRMVLAILPSMSFQHGLLSTPYHRVYFTDDSEKVENLPEDRWKFPLGIRLNSFLGSGIILRTYYRFYHDSYGIQAHTIGLEVPLKLSVRVTLSPFTRFYHQKGTAYFHPYGKHSPEQDYYTSDYDLSDFTSVSAGMAFRLSPVTLGTTSSFRAVEIRYSTYHRSDGLIAHSLSSFFDLSFQKK